MQALLDDGNLVWTAVVPLAVVPPSTSPLPASKIPSISAPVPLLLLFLLLLLHLLLLLLLMLFYSLISYVLSATVSAIASLSPIAPSSAPVPSATALPSSTAPSTAPPPGQTNIPPPAPALLSFICSSFWTCTCSVFCSYYYSYFPLCCYSCTSSLRAPTPPVPALFPHLLLLLPLLPLHLILLLPSCNLLLLPLLPKHLFYTLFSFFSALPFTPPPYSATPFLFLTHSSVLTSFTQISPISISLPPLSHLLFLPPPSHTTYLQAHLSLLKDCVELWTRLVRALDGAYKL